MHANANADANANGQRKAIMESSPPPMSLSMVFWSSVWQIYWSGGPHELRFDMNGAPNILKAKTRSESSTLRSRSTRASTQTHDKDSRWSGTLWPQKCCLKLNHCKCLSLSTDLGHIQPVSTLNCVDPGARWSKIHSKFIPAFSHSPFPISVSFSYLSIPVVTVLSPLPFSCLCPKPSIYSSSSWSLSL